MTAVIDASLALTWFFEDEATPRPTGYWTACATRAPLFTLDHELAAAARRRGGEVYP